MIVVHEETLWSPAPQPMDDDDEMNYVMFLNQTSPSPTDHG